jgi:Holliday junction DNA helicase RuvA
MIARLRGTIAEKGRDFLIVDVGGVGYLVTVSGPTLARTGPVGADVTLRTYQYVREDALQLYGFLTAEEEETFERLLGVSGIGPRSALSSLTQFTPMELSRAVAQRDITGLSRIKGVGRRTAERMALELQGKLTEPAAGEGPALPLPSAGDDAAAALVAMGYTASEAGAALALGPAAGTASTEERIMLALRALDRQRS